MLGFKHNMSSGLLGKSCMCVLAVAVKQTVILTPQRQKRGEKVTGDSLSPFI